MHDNPFNPGSMARDGMPRPAEDPERRATGTPASVPSQDPSLSHAHNGKVDGTDTWDVLLRAVFAVLVLLKCTVLLTEPKIWTRADPVMPGMTMWMTVGLALLAEAFVFFTLGERRVSASWKALSLLCFVFLVGAYRVSGMILNGLNLAGCDCFGIAGRWLSGRESTFLAIGLLGLFVAAALRYGNAALRKEGCHAA